MPKICEICQQPYDDTLTSCPNCDIVDIFGSAPAVGPASDPKTARPVSADATTKVQGPLPPVGASINPPGTPKPPPLKPPTAAPKAPASGPVMPPTAPPVPPPVSPLMSRAVGSKPPQVPAPGGGAATHLPSSGAAPPTMVAPQQGAPTMVAKGAAVPTMITPESQYPAPVPGGKAAAQPPKGAAPAAPPAKGAVPAAPAAKGPAATPPAGKGAPATMLPQGVAKPTQVAKGAAPPTMIMPPGELPHDMPGGAAALGQPPSKKTQMPQGAKMPTMLAPEGTEPLDVEGKPADPKKTMLPKGAAMATMLSKTGQPTTLAPEGTEPLEIEGGAPAAPVDPKKTKLPQGTKMPTMLAKTGQPTTLAPEGTEALDLPVEGKKTVIPRRPHGTVMAPEGTGPMEPPTEGKKTVMPPRPHGTVMAPEGTPPLEPPGQQKKTQLPQGVRQPTILAPPEEATALEIPGEGKKTKLPQGVRQPTILAPPEEATAMEIPGQTRLPIEPPPEPVPVDMGLDSASKYDTAPPPPVVQPGYKKRWFGGMVLGFLLTIGVLSALWFFRHEEPVVSWLKAIGLQKYPAIPSLKDAMALLDAGEFDEAIAHIKGLSHAEQATPEAQAVLGEALWFKHLKEKEGKVDAGDSELGSIQEALNKGKTAQEVQHKVNGTAWLGHIEETVGHGDKAKSIYGEGAKSFKPHEPIFTSAINRVDALGPARTKSKDKGELDIPKDEGKDKKDAKDKADDGKKDDAKDKKDNGKDKKDDGGQARATLSDLEVMELMALILNAQQAGEAAQASEAGAKFWQAYRLMQKGDAAAARKVLQEAKAIHEKQRWARLRKAQNPYSDPTEEIFLRSVDDLANYWPILEKLKKEYPDRDPLKAMELLILAKTKPNEALEQIAKALGVKNDTGIILDKIAEFADDSKNGSKVRQLAKDAKYLNEENKDALKAGDIVIDDAKTKIKIAERVDKAGVKDEKDTDKAVGLIIDQRDKLQQTYDKAGQMLADAKYINPKPNHEEFLKGVELAIEAATSPLVAALGRTLNGFGRIAGQAPVAGSPASSLAAALAAANLQIEILKGREAQLRTPRQMLEFWLPVLANKEQKEIKDIADRAAQDARMVLQDRGTDAAGKAAAHSVQGMVNRVQGNFDGARTEIAEALKQQKAAKEGAWRKYANSTLRELNDPNVYYLPRGEELSSINNFSLALDVLDAGVGAFPRDGRVLALRAQVRLERARSQAKAPLTLRDPLVAEARKDAEAAVAAGAAGEGNYALGRVFEDTNDPVAAEQAYRRALQANPAADRAGSRYRVALGRVLLKLNPLPGQQPAIPAPAAAPAPNRVGQLPVSETELRTTLTLMLVGVVADDDETPELDEIIRLADQAIKAKNYEGYLVKAGALARKGMWTEALRMYSEGLRYLIRPEYAEGLNALVNNHPAFNLPDPLRNPDPLRAERHYGAGLRAYFAGQYTLAEREFLEAYRNQGQDARILYYLGLTRLPQQGKRSAATVNFQMAAILEQQNKPSPAAVNASLERVQGELRRFLTAYRP